MNRLRVGRQVVVVLVNWLAAIFGTVVISDPFVRLLLPVRASVPLALAADSLELACSFTLGILIYWRWRRRESRWVWVPGLVLFGVGLVVTGSWTLWAFWDVSKDPVWMTPERVVQWSVFTVPFLRTVGYSLGAYICSKAMHRKYSVSEKSNI